MTQTLQEIEAPPVTAPAAQTQTQVSAQAQAAGPLPLRVGWVGAADTLERLGRAFNPLAVGLVDELVKLTAVVPESSSLADLPSPPVEVLTYRRPSLLGGWSRHLKELIESLHRQKVQVLHALEAPAWPVCRRLARELDCPCVVSVWALGDADRLARLDDRVRAVAAVSEPICGELEGRHVAAPERIRLIRPGLFQVRHATCFQDPQCSDSIVVSGRLDYSPPFETVLKSLAELQSRQYDCVYFLIGNGKAEKRLRTFAERLGLCQRLTFVDQQPARQLTGILKAADLYIMPGGGPHLPLEALGAQAAGVPVLFNSAEAADFLIHGQTALRFAPTDAAELTDVLGRLLSDRDWARLLAERALEHLRAHHAVGRFVADVVELYRSCVRA